MFATIAAARVLFLSGLTALLISLLLMASCRCVPSKGLLGALRRASWFTRLFSRHCILWTLFAVILVVHVVFAIGFLGIPW